MDPHFENEVLRSLAEGTVLRYQDVQKIHKTLVEKPEDINARAKLLGYVRVRSRNVYRKKLWREQLYGLAFYWPAHPINCDPACRIVFTEDIAFNSQMRSLWKKQIKLSPMNVDILVNAASSLMYSDLKMARKCIQSARQLDPSNSRLLRLADSFIKLEELYADLELTATNEEEMAKLRKRRG